MMKKLIALLWLLTLSAFAGDINPGYTPVDGQRLTAAELLQLVNQATINTSFYTSQTASGTNLQVGDTILGVSGGVFRKFLGAQIINNPALFTGAPVYTNAPNFGLLLYYNPTNLDMETIVITNLFNTQSSNVLVANLLYTGTNASSSNVRVQLLPAYALTNFWSTNNQNAFLTWDTNGIASYVTGSNFLQYAKAPLGTNILVPYIWTNTFQPWLIYATNAFTNVWGYYTNFPVTNYLFTNNAFTQTNLPATISNWDTIPFNSSAQSTNTTMTVEALYEYFTNRQTFPAFAIARVQFNGTAYSFNCTNTDGVNHLFRVTNSILVSGTPTAVSWQFSGDSAVSMVCTPQVESNTVYYAMATATNRNYFRLYTNWGDCFVPQHELAPTGAGTLAANQNVLLICTNYTSYNADAIQLCNVASISTGQYSVYFRTNLPNNLYYLTGSGQPQAANPTFGITVGQASPGSYSVSNVDIITAVDGVGLYAPLRTQVLIQPQ